MVVPGFYTYPKWRRIGQAGQNKWQQRNVLDNKKYFHVANQPRFKRERLLRQMSFFCVHATQHQRLAYSSSLSY